jgi:hypothetical protein
VHHQLEHIGEEEHGISFEVSRTSPFVQFTMMSRLCTSGQSQRGLEETTVMMVGGKCIGTDIQQQHNILLPANG